MIIHLLPNSCTYDNMVLLLLMALTGCLSWAA